MRFLKSSLPEPNTKYLYFFALFNVLLILLIFVFFLPNLTMPQGLSVLLPRAISSEPVSREGFVVFILKDNTIYLGKRSVSFDELKRFFSIRKDENKNFQVLIKADKEADIGVLVKVWDLFRESGAFQVNIATNG